MGLSESKYVRCMRRIFKVCMHRAMFVTKKGYIGLAPWNAVRGDKVAILIGGYTPFLLREKAGTDVYELVVESYMAGLMNGEALKIADGQDWMTLKLS